nr:uncharacterized protein LOC127321617 isoform X3 [Lolium perenne]
MNKKLRNMCTDVRNLVPVGAVMAKAVPARMEEMLRKTRHQTMNGWLLTDCWHRAEMASVEYFNLMYLTCVFCWQDMENHEGCMGQIDLDHTSVGNSMQDCSGSHLAAIHLGYGAQAGGTPSDSLALVPSGGEWTMAELQRQLLLTNWFSPPVAFPNPVQAGSGSKCKAT